MSDKIQRSEIRKGEVEWKMTTKSEPDWRQAVARLAIAVEFTIPLTESIQLRIPQVASQTETGEDGVEMLVVELRQKELAIVEA
jgi:hypothetical protein